MSTEPRLKVAICGSGMGGLTLAFALADYQDLTIDVYEAAARFEEIGAGLAIWGRGVTALKRLGLEERLQKIAPLATENSVFELRKADIPAGGHPIGHLALSPNWGFQRAHFVFSLIEAVKETGRVNVHFGKRCTSFSQSDGIGEAQPVSVYFKDGSSIECDVLVGCDGIKSAVRAELQKHTDHANGPPTGEQQFHALKFSGSVAYRMLVTPEELIKVAGGPHPAQTVRKMYCGKDKHVVTYPVAGGRFINLIAYCSIPEKQQEWESGPWVIDVEHAEVLQRYEDFEPEVQMLLKCVKGASRWAMYEVEPLPRWSKHHVTLLGDSAHAMTPFIGAGGGQVIEDVYILSRLIGSPTVTKEVVPLALRVYEHIRRPRATRTLRCTQETKKAFQYQEEYCSADGLAVEEALTVASEWLREGNGDIDDDVALAMELIKAGDLSFQVGT